MNFGQQYISQISKIENVSGSNIKRNMPFAIKVIGDDALELSVKLENSEDFVTTTFQSGWNPEIVKEIASVEANKIQIGF